MASRIVVITAVVAICISVIISGYLTRVRKQEMKKRSEEISHSAPKGYPVPPRAKPPPAQKRKAADGLKSKRGGWGGFMLPFYGLGILAYIVYILVKITAKKYTNGKSNSQLKVGWNKESRSKGKSKTKITMYELQQLEQRLQETEAAVQQIFAQTCEAVDAATKTLQSSSDEEYSARPIKRLKKMSTKHSSSTDGESDSESEEPPSSDDKVNPACSKTVSHLRRRRVKRTERKRQRLVTTSSSSNSEPDDHVSVDRKDSDGFLPSSEEENEKCHCDEFHKGEGDLLQTAKDIRSTMLELQSYVSQEKAELLAD